VSKDGAGAIIEVFRPRELPAFHNFLTDVSRILYDTDVSLDYHADINLDVISDFDENGRLVSPWHPIELDEALAPVAEEALEMVAAKVAALTPATREESIVEEWPERNLKLTVEITDIRESTGEEPARSVSNGKSYGGYEPTGMLSRLMKPIIGKAKKRQAGGRGEHARVLVCDVSGTVMEAHLEDRFRKDGYAEVLQRALEPQVKENYDVIALCTRHSWAQPLQLHFAVCAGDEYHAIVHELFGLVEVVPPAA
jgi:hypothetical protein